MTEFFTKLFGKKKEASMQRRVDMKRRRDDLDEEDITETKEEVKAIAGRITTIIEDLQKHANGK